MKHRLVVIGSDGHKISRDHFRYTCTGKQITLFSLNANVDDGNDNNNNNNHETTIRTE